MLDSEVIGDILLFSLSIVADLTDEIRKGKFFDEFKNRRFKFLQFNRLKYKESLHFISSVSNNIVQASKHVHLLTQVRVSAALQLMWTQFVPPEFIF